MVMWALPMLEITSSFSIISVKLRFASCCHSFYELRQILSRTVRQTVSQVRFSSILSILDTILRLLCLLLELQQPHERRKSPSTSFSKFQLKFYDIPLLLHFELRQQNKTTDLLQTKVTASLTCLQTRDAHF